jgi:uncharacterized protein YpmS
MCPSVSFHGINQILGLKLPAATQFELAAAFSGTASLKVTGYSLLGKTSSAILIFL